MEQYLPWIYIHILVVHRPRHYFPFETAQQIWCLLLQNFQILQAKLLFTEKIPTRVCRMQLQHLLLLWQKVIFNFFISKIKLLEKLEGWNRLIIEYTQAQPLNSAGAYYSLRIFVGSSSTSRVYFADLAGTASPPPLFFGVTNMVLDFCSKFMDSITPKTRETNKDGNFDIVNFLWFAGPSGVYQNTTGTYSRLSSYHISIS